MSSKEKNKKNREQQQIVERVKYFMKYQQNNNNKDKNLKRIPNYDIYSTLIDPINIQHDNKNNIFNNNFNFTQNLNGNQIIKEKLNDTTVDTQNYNILEIPIKKSISIPVSKELAKYIEPRSQRKEFLKISPKFASNENNINNKINDNNYSKHKYTSSELEILETDEKIPQKKIENITNNILINNENKENKENKENINTEDIYSNTDALLLIFHFLINIEKCHQDLSKDFNRNNLGNIEYKLKVACKYFSILIEEKNLLSDIILNDEDDINIFLIRELCLYLTILFLDNFSNGLNDNNINEFLTCHNYCHINFLYVIIIVINIIEKKILENKIKFSENTIEFKDFQECKFIIQTNKDKININKYKNNFHTNNKIIKNILSNILNNLNDINNDITQYILQIFKLSKKSKFKEILNDYIKNKSLINEKINNINKKYYSPEYNNNEGNQINENDTKKEVFPPYLPPKKKDDKREYCLVLDLDETLVHFFEDNDEAYVKVRMGAEHFITVLSQYCEIVIFTASTQYYADIVLDGFDCKNLIDYKLYREHTQEYNGINVKDLSKLGRDLNKIIIIDNIEENYSFQPNNGLNISEFEGDENDNELQFLLEDLLEIVTVPGKNVTYELPRIRKNMVKRYFL